MDKDENILDKTVGEIKAETDKVMKSVADMKEAHAESLKSHDALTEEKLKRIEDDVTGRMEKMQKDTAAHKARMEQMEASLNRADKGGEDMGLAKERAKAFDSWMRDKKSGQDTIELIGLDQAEQKEMQTQVNPDGGYLVRPEFADKVASRIFESSPIRQLASVQTIGSKSLIITLDDQEAGGGWAGEQETRSETTTPQLGEIEITAHELFANPKATTAMLEDSAINLENFLSGKVSSKFSRLEATAFVTGNGIKKPRGFLDYAASASSAYERDALEQVNSGNASLVTADGVVDLQNSLKEFYQTNATWLMKRSTFGAVMKLQDVDGAYLFNLGLNNVGLPTLNLLNRPVMFADDMPAIADNALAMAYGDFREGYQIVDRRGITVLRDPYTTKGKVEFYTTKRVGGDVINYEAIKIGKVAA